MATHDTRLLLLIDNDETQARAHAGVAQREGWRILNAASRDAALTVLSGTEGRDVACVLLNAGLVGDDICAFVARIRMLRPNLCIIVSTDSASPLLAVDAMRAGANDYLVTPVDEGRLARALEIGSAYANARQDELQPLTEKLDPAPDFDAMVGTDTRFRTALAKAATAARGHGHMLVEGETGTGKATLLRAVHHGSARAKAPIETVDCAALPTASLQSALFGHEKGAFAGAFDRQDGALSRCDGGTIVLNHVDATDRETQDRLADMLATGIVRPTGATHGFRVDIRILAASSRPLDVLSEDGRFSPDLYEALGATRIVLPPLRERGSDIAMLTRHFLAEFATIENIGHHSIADSALSLLEAYDWPENVRQLQTVLFRACIHEQREALTAHSFPHLQDLVGEATHGHPRIRKLDALLYEDDGHIRALEDIEGDIIRLAIGHYRGKMTEVARRLGIGRSTLYRKLHDLGIDNAA